MRSALSPRPTAWSSPCRGGTPTIVVEFGILANSISERCGIPRELLAMAVMKGAEMERDLSSGSVCIDKGAIDRARGGEK